MDIGKTAGVRGRRIVGKSAGNTSVKQKQSKKGIVISAALMMVLIAVTFYVVFQDNDFNDVLGMLGTVNPWWIGAGFAAVALYFAMQGFTFMIPLNRLGFRLKFRDHIGFALSGFYFSGITPSASGGQPMQLFYMMRCGVPAADASLALLVTNIAFQASVMLLGLVLLILRFSFVAAKVSAMQALILLGYLIAAAVFAGLLFLTFSVKFAERSVKFFIRVLAKLRVVKNPESARRSAELQIAEYKRGAAGLKTYPGMLFRVLGVTLLQMMFYFSVPFFIYHAFGLGGANFLDLMAMQAILYMAVAYLPLPGAVGVTERGFVLMFASFFTEELLVPAMLLSRGLTFYFPMLVSGAAVLVMQISGKRAKMALPKI